MKLFVLALLLPLLGKAQPSVRPTAIPGVVGNKFPETSFIVEDQKVIFEKTFSSKLKREELSKKLYTFYAAVKNLKMGNAASLVSIPMTGELFRYQCDVMRYRDPETPGIMTMPIHAAVTIRLKDFQYEVSIADITFRVKSAENAPERDLKLEDYLISMKGGGQAKESKTNVKLLQLMDRDFSNLFELDKAN